MVFHKFGRVMYSNCALRADLKFDFGIARHVFWRFWFVSGGDK